MIRILIVDDVPLFRVGLRWTLEQMDDCSVVGESTQVVDILQLAQAEHPDVVLLHEGLATASALEIACLLLQQVEQRGLFVLAASGTEEQVFRFARAGAAAYESRWITPADLVDKVRRVSAGEYLISSDSIRNARQEIPPGRALRHSRPQRSQPDPLDSGSCPLTTREIEMLERIAAGMSNKEIAQDLGISDQTVKNHITSLMKKLGVEDRTAAVMYALRRHWITLDEPRKRGHPVSK